MPPEMNAASVLFRSFSVEAETSASSGSTHFAPANWPVNDQSNSATSAM